MNEQTSRLNRERRFLVLLGVICLALIGGALYMQIVLGEAPCPLCILQRYALLLIAVFAFIGAAMPGKRSLTLLEGLVVLSAIVASPLPVTTCTSSPIRQSAAASTPCNRSSTACRWPRCCRWCSRSMASVPRRTRRSWACPWRNGHW